MWVLKDKGKRMRDTLKAKGGRIRDKANRCKRGGRIP
jgi:hypothetical protein